MLNKNLSDEFSTEEIYTFDDDVRITGFKKCHNSDNISREKAASLILASDIPKQYLTSKLRCSKKYIMFSPQLSISNNAILNRIPLKEVLGFYLAPSHPNTLVILFQQPTSHEVHLYGIKLSCSSKTQDLMKILSESNPRLPANDSKTKTVKVNLLQSEINPKENKSNYLESKLKPENDKSEINWSKIRSEYIWNRTTPSDSDFKNPAKQINGEVPRDQNYISSSFSFEQDNSFQKALSDDRTKNTYRDLNLKSQNKKSNELGRLNLSVSRTKNSSESDYRQSLYSPSPFSEHSATNLTNYVHGLRKISAYLSKTDEHGFNDDCYTLCPNDPNENVEQFSIGYYNDEDDTEDFTHENYLKQTKVYSNTDEPAQDAWVENITFINKNPKNGAFESSEGSVYMYVAQQVNSRINQSNVINLK